MWKTRTVLKIIAAWAAFKTVLLGAVWIVAFSGHSSFVTGGASATPTATPTPDLSISRPTSDPYTGDLARFDRENRAARLQIQRVMDILEIKPGSSVADIGAGGGWFSVIAAKRVGETGKVYAVDISEDSINYIRNRIEKEALVNIEPVLGAADAVNLPENSVDAVLILNTYHEISEPVALLRDLRTAMKKGGLVGIIDRVGKGDDHGVDPEDVKKEAKRAGFGYVAVYDFVNDDRMDYFLVFSVGNGDAPLK